jgi:ribonuclease Z
MLLDCGEGAWTGLVTVAGAASAAAMLRDLAAIWISHQHADHCLGLVDLLGNKACVGVLKTPTSHFFQNNGLPSGPLHR